MKIELRKLQIFLAGSEETINFVADLYVDNVKTAYVRNGGRGGNTDYTHYEGVATMELLKKAEAYCLALPPEKIPDGSGGFDEFPMDLEDFIDNMVDAEVKKMEQKKIEKKLAKDQLKGLVFTDIPEGEIVSSWNFISWKGKIIVDLLANPGSRIAMKAEITKQLAKGKRLLNTNLPAEFLNPKETVA